MCVKRGEVYYCDLGGRLENRGCEQWGTRPCVIIQNDVGNTFSPTTIVIPLTSSSFKKPLPTHAELDTVENNWLNCLVESVSLAEQIRVIDKSRIKRFVGELSEDDMKKVDKTLLVSLALN